MKKALAVAGLTIAAALAAHPAEAQLQTTRITVTPVAGWYLPVQDLARVADGDGAVPVRRESSPMLGVAVEAAFRGTPVSARAHMAYAPAGDLVAVRRAGEVSCGSNCVRFTYAHDRLSSSSAFLAVGDAVLRAQTGKVRPYIAGGAGLRRYGFAAPQLEGNFANAFANDVTRLIVHVGAGLEGTVGPTSLQLDVGDYFGHYPRIGTSPIGLQHDLTISLGVRFSVR